MKKKLRELRQIQMQDLSLPVEARERAAAQLWEIGDPRFVRLAGHCGEYIAPPMVRITAGRYPMGDDSGESNEGPAHHVTLPEFWIGRYSVTNAEFELFMKAGAYSDRRWWSDESELPREMQPRYWGEVRFRAKTQPVVGVSWYEATAYSGWLTATAFGEDVWRARQGYRLMSEAEYEAAARGVEGRRYAYGNIHSPQLANTWESDINRPTAVGIYPPTQEGVFDLTGNVFQWTRSIADTPRFPYPYRADDGREEIDPRYARRLLRGGSWLLRSASGRAAYRVDGTPSSWDSVTGFRLVCVVPSR